MRKTPNLLGEMRDGMNDLETFTNAETESWTNGKPVAPGARFDTCDLRAWLDVAQKAGVPVVPAREILRLHEDDLDVLSGPVDISPLLRAGLARASSKVDLPADTSSHEHPTDATPQDLDALAESLYAAMDDVPENWMVRSHICGPSTLKTYAGAGLADPMVPGVSMDADLSVGPGWVRNGNRRRIDAVDQRYVDLFPQGHGTHISYLARPWLEATRHVIGDDPHRHGSIFAGKGKWPCEWRVFVTQGRVSGVANYYGWAGDISPLAAQKALAASHQAQKILDYLTQHAIEPRDINLIIADRQTKSQPANQALLAPWMVAPSFTLDFIEGPEGLTFLEGGPGHTVIGGAHPCAFAGVGVSASTGLFCECEGVALRLMDHVLLGDTSTWSPDPTSPHILTWDEARALAQQE